MPERRAHDQAPRVSPVTGGEGIAGMELGFEFIAMGGPCEIRLRCAREHHARQLAEVGINEVRRIEARYSRFRADSWLAHVNASAGDGQWVAMDPEASALLEFAGELWRLSEGRFDPTCGALSDLWRVSARAGRPPDDGALREALGRVGWAGVERRQGSEGSAQVRLARAGMHFDLGGIGKEYAADRAAQAMQNLYASGAMGDSAAGGYVNLAGDIRVWGGCGPWQVAIAHPRKPGGVVARVAVNAGAIATSGDCERGFVHAGRRYSHVIDARSGWPVDRAQSVSVRAPSCAAAGAAATMALLMGDEAEAFLHSEGLAFCLVGIDGVPVIGGSTEAKGFVSSERGGTIIGA